jgi:hypothetical protein
MKLFVATPMFGGQCAGIFADSMCQLYDMCVSLRIPIQHRFAFNGSLITALRTNLANEFMASDASKLLFIDADIGFDPRYVLDLIKHSADFEVIGAPYLKKNIHWDKVVEAIDRVDNPHQLNYYTGDYAVKLVGETLLDPTVTDPVEAEYLGAGFMLISRLAFQLFQTSYPDRSYGGGTKTLYFTAEIQDDKYISEDVFFCNMIRKAGGKIGCCPWMKISHFGNHVYGGPPRQFT